MLFCAARLIDSRARTMPTKAFVGMVRARESINRAAQNNIKQFLQAVETVDVEKPMFPNEKK